MRSRAAATATRASRKRGRGLNMKGIAMRSYAERSTVPAGGPAVRLAETARAEISQDAGSSLEPYGSQELPLLLRNAPRRRLARGGFYQCRSSSKPTARAKAAAL